MADLQQSVLLMADLQQSVLLMARDLQQSAMARDLQQSAIMHEFYIFTFVFISARRPSRRWQDDIAKKEGTTFNRKALDRSIDGGLHQEVDGHSLDER